MLAIRLQRNGRTHLPVYRIIVQEAQRHPLSGRVVADLGTHDPHTKRTTLDKEKAQKYLNNGAQPSSRVVRILKEQGIKLPKWVAEAPKKAYKAKHADKLRKNQPKEETPAEEPAAEAPTETPAEALTETPAE
ncbi:30S ribosomal protein S16 [Christensenellaceae bacterium OttesenSCG-928-L17]|nr:30S ribosomal protein S16 [Christensenellaceae bacterium OttesenSCG-928-L17]